MMNGKNKVYAVHYVVKKFGAEFGRKCYVYTDTAKHAAQIFKKYGRGNCLYEMGRHAFRVTANPTDEIITTQYIYIDGAEV